MANIYEGTTSQTAAYLTGLQAASSLVYRYPQDLGGGGSVETTPFVVFAPYKRKGALLSLNPGAVLSTLPTPSFNVVLPLPSSALRTQYGVTYAPVTLGAALAGQMQTFSTTKPGAAGTDSFAAQVGSGGVSELLKKLAGSALEGLRQKVEEEGIDLATVFMFGDQDAGREAIYGLAGQRPNTFTENLFKDVNFRDHEFSYTFMPRSAEESVKVDEIIRLMRFFMLPAYAKADLLGQITTTNGAVLDFPYEFQILYSVFDTTFMLLPSVLTEMSVDYSGGTDAPQFFTARGVTPTNRNYPARVSVTMRFKEMMFLTRNRVEVDPQTVREKDAEYAASTYTNPDGTSGTYTRFRF